MSLLFSPAVAADPAPPLVRPEVLLVVGPGAEDPRAPLAHLVHALRAREFAVWGLDPDEAEDRNTDGASAAVGWVLRRHRVTAAAVVPGRHPHATDRVLAALHAHGVPVHWFDASALEGGSVARPGAVILPVSVSSAAFGMWTEPTLDVMVRGHDGAAVHRAADALRRHGLRVVEEGPAGRGRPPVGALGRHLGDAAVTVVVEGPVPLGRPTIALLACEATAAGSRVLRSAPDAPDLCDRVLAAMGRRGVAPVMTAAPADPADTVVAALDGAGARMPLRTPVVRPGRRPPTVSVVIPVWNMAAYVGSAIESVLAQTYPWFELHVIDNESTDGTASVVDRYVGDPRVRFTSGVNVHPSNRQDFYGMRVLDDVRTDFFVSMGADDLCLPDRLERQLRAFGETPGTDICHAGAVLIDATGRDIGQQHVMIEPYSSASMARTMAWGCVLSFGTVMLRRRAIERIGYISGGLIADYEWWLRASTVCTFRYLPAPVLRYRIHEQSTSASTDGVAMVQPMARRTRDEAFARFGMCDLYPGAIDGDPRIVAAAHLDLGVRLMGGQFPDPRQALDHFSAAASAHPAAQEAAVVNAAVTLALAGERDAAIDLVARSPHPMAASCLTMLRSGTRPDPARHLVPSSTVASGDELDGVGVVDGIVLWDGSAPGRRRVLVLDSPDVDGVRAGVDAAVAASGGRPVDIVHLADGRAHSEVVAFAAATMPMTAPAGPGAPGSAVPVDVRVLDGVRRFTPLAAFDDVVA